MHWQTLRYPLPRSHIYAWSEPTPAAAGANAVLMPEVDKNTSEVFIIFLQAMVPATNVGLIQEP